MLLVVKEIMDHIAPLGNIYQAGTLSGNPLAMTSGYETLSQLTPETYEYFNMLGDILEDGLKRVFAKHNVPITVNRAGSMIGYFLNEGPVTNFEQANKSDLKLFAEMYREMAKEGVFYHHLNLKVHSYLRHTRKKILKNDSSI